jgi:hypothetical protein
MSERIKRIEVDRLSNAAMVERYAAPGRVGLVGGQSLIDRAIRQLQRSVTSGRKQSLWSHAFLFGGRRVDGHHWILESDLVFERKHMRLGVQENRASKYFDPVEYPNFAILDFGLNAAQRERVVAEGLELLAGLTEYSLRELAGTLLSMERPSMRTRDNLLARENSLYCSAMVQHCFASAAIKFSPGVSHKNVTPEDLANTKIAHTQYLLVRQS